MNVFTHVKTPPSGLVVSLAEAKRHLHVDNETFGVASKFDIGSADHHLILTARLEGIDPNAWTVAIVVEEANQTLSVTFLQGAWTITLATDDMIVVTSTPLDVIGLIQADAVMNSLVSCSTGEGTGEDIVEDAGDYTFSGGVDGTSIDDSKITSLLLAAQTNVESYLQKKLLTQTLVQIQDNFPFDIVLRLDFGPLQSITSVKYYDDTATLVDLDASNYIVDIRAPYPALKLAPLTLWPFPQTARQDAVEIEYVAGWASASLVPDDLKLGILMLVGHWYSNREGVMISAGLTSITLDFGITSLLSPWRDVRF